MTAPAHFCSQCGQPLAGAARFCAACGASVDAPGPAASPEAVAPARYVRPPEPPRSAFASDEDEDAPSPTVDDPRGCSRTLGVLFGLGFIVMGLMLVGISFGPGTPEPILTAIGGGLTVAGIALFAWVRATAPPKPPLRA